MNAFGLEADRTALYVTNIIVGVHRNFVVP